MDDERHFPVKSLIFLHFFQYRQTRTMDNGIYEDNSIYPDPEEFNRFPWMSDNANITPNELLSLSRGPIIHEGFVPDDDPNGYDSEMEVDDEAGLEGSHRRFAGRLDDYSGLGNYDARDSSYSLSEGSPYVVPSLQFPHRTNPVSEMTLNLVTKMIVT